jgi:hypothetical protein
MYPLSIQNHLKIRTLCYLKVDYHTKAKNRSRVGESFSGASTTSNSSIINGLTSHSDFNGAINHIAVVPPMKSNVTTSNNQQRTMLQQPPPHNMSLPLTSTSSSPCQFNLDAGKKKIIVVLVSI